MVPIYRLTRLERIPATCTRTSMAVIYGTGWEIVIQMLRGSALWFEIMLLKKLYLGEPIPPRILQRTAHFSKYKKFYKNLYFGRSKINCFGVPALERESPTKEQVNLTCSTICPTFTNFPTW